MIAIRITADRKGDDEWRYIDAIKVERDPRRRVPDVLLASVDALRVWAGADSKEILRLVREALNG